VHSTGKQALFNLRIISNTKVHSTKLYAACANHWSGKTETLPSTCQVAAVNTVLMHSRTLNACNGSIVHRSVLFIREPKHLSCLKYFTVNNIQVRHSRCVDRITSIVKLSQTRLLNLYC